MLGRSMMYVTGRVPHTDWNLQYVGRRPGKKTGKSIRSHSVFNYQGEALVFSEVVGAEPLRRFLSREVVSETYLRKVSLQVVSL